MIINISVNINRNIIQIQLRLNFTEQRTNVIHDKVCRQLHPLQQEPFNNLEEARRTAIPIAKYSFLGIAQTGFSLYLCTIQSKVIF